MQIKLFTVPLLVPDQELAALNRFLANHKILEVEQQLINSKEGVYWSFCVRFLVGGGTMAARDTSGSKKQRNKIDYKEVLDAATFERFSLLRRVRKNLAEEEAVPAFAVFTDAELAQVAALTHLSPATLRKIPGIGEKKVAKYAARFIEQVTQADEANGQLD